MRIIMYMGVYVYEYASMCTIRNVAKFRHSKAFFVLKDLGRIRWRVFFFQHTIKFYLFLASSTIWLHVPVTNGQWMLFHTRAHDTNIF